MIKTKEFELHGVQYRTTHFSAIEALPLLDTESDLRVLGKTEVRTKKNKWLLLADASINKHVRDLDGEYAPLLVLNELLILCYEFNFSFSSTWNPVKYPREMSEGAEAVESHHTNTMFARIIAGKLATLRELETYYNLEDAFKLFDILAAESVNDFRANQVNR